MSAPDPGIYPGLPMQEYLSWDCASAGRLSDLRHAPAYMREKIVHPDAPTPAQIIGTALHTAILEPEEFDHRYALRPEGHGNSNAFKDAKSRLIAAGFVVLDADDMALCRGASAAVAAHPLVGGLLRLPDAEHEVSIVWDQLTVSGFTVRCKIRPDFLDRETKLVIDLKSTLNASKDAFSSQLYNLGYHRSAAFYIDGCRASGIDIDTYLFLAVEKEPPYLVALYQLEQTAIECGRKEVEGLLDLYGRCETKSEWPGLPDGVIPIGLPGWAYDRAMRGGE